MKDGEIWVVEYRNGEKWHMVLAVNLEGNAIENCDGFNRCGKHQYRVVKYIRQEATEPKKK